jgi:hypothetical protein
VDGRNKSGHDEMHCLSFVMPGLVPGIHVTALQQAKTWMASEVGLARLPHNGELQVG